MSDLCLSGHLYVRCGVEVIRIRLSRGAALLLQHLQQSLFFARGYFRIARLSLSPTGRMVSGWRASLVRTSGRIYLRST